MFNVSPEQERRHIVDDSALNGFLTKMYSIMGLAVLVSALTAYLTLTVFSGSLLPLLTNRVFLWVLLLLPLILSVGISFKATRKPTAAFFMLLAIAVIYGLEFSLLASPTQAPKSAGPSSRLQPSSSVWQLTAA